MGPSSCVSGAAAAVPLPPGAALQALLLSAAANTFSSVGRSPKPAVPQA